MEDSTEPTPEQIKQKEQLKKMLKERPDFFVSLAKRNKSLSVSIEKRKKRKP